MRSPFKKFLLILFITLLISSFWGKLGYSTKKTESYAIFYDFVENANYATWKSGKGTLPFPGSDTDSRGFALWRINYYMEDGNKYPKVLETHPEWITTGWIEGTYPQVTIPNNASLVLKIGFLKGATNSDGVIYNVFLNISGKPIKIFEYYKTYNQSLYSTTIDLSKYAGKNGNFILHVDTGGKSSSQDWACWIDAKIIYEPPSYPDLVILDFWNDNGIIRYKIKNIGNASTSSAGTPIPITNKLFINGKETATDTIFQTLNPNQEIESYFKNYTYPSPTTTEVLMVCADTNNVISESNENNNCLQKTFYPQYGGIKVDSGCPNVKIEIFDEKNKLVKTGYSDEKNMYSTGLTLLPGTYRVVPSKEGCTFDPNERVVIVQANQLVGVYFKCICKKGPDLVIIEILRIETESTIHYKIKNIGDEKTNSYFKNALYIDGKFVSEDEIDVYLNPGEELISKFLNPSPYIPTPPEDKIKICADYKNVIKEADETNNCLEVTWKLPDLIIENVNCDFENKKINYTIKNIGHYKTYRSFDIALYVDGELKDVNSISDELKPDDIYSGYFKNYTLPCANLYVKVIVDVNNFIVEENEANNTKELNCVCKLDNTPPKITKGPIVDKITQNSAVIYWETDEESDSEVILSTKSQSEEKKEKDKRFVLNHSISLTNLKPGVIYEFYVKSTDRSGNFVKSKYKYFKTLEEEDNEKPTINLIVPSQMTGKTKIIANVRDNKNIDRVIFLIDGIEVYTDYSYPYEYFFDTKSYSNGFHNFGAYALDKSGNRIYTVVGGEIINTVAIFHVSILEPQPNSVVGGLTTVKIRVESTVNFDEWFGVSKVEIYENDTLKSSMEYGGERCIVERQQRRCITLPPEPLPFEKSYDILIKEAERENENRNIKLSVKVHFSNGIICEESVNLIRKFTPIKRINVVRRVYKSGNHYDVEVIVVNTGNIDFEYNYFCLDDYHKGYMVGTNIKVLKPGNIEDQNWSYELTYKNFDPTLGNPNLNIKFSKKNFLLEPREFRIIKYQLVPILYDIIQVEHLIGYKPIEVEYGENESLVKIEHFNESYSGENELLQLTRVSDYLIVTNPVSLYDNNIHRLHGYNELLSIMAELAIEKNGILGFVVTPVPVSSEVYRDTFLYWGNNYLRNDWSENGYLLIVGETEIVPSFTSRWDPICNGRDDTTTIHCTDHPYASTSGELIHPEICIGRIIGDDAYQLKIPIQTSLDVKNGKAEFLRNKTGHPNPIKSFPFTLYSGDKVSTGDINDDGKDEIIIASDKDDKIKILDMNGNIIKQWSLNIEKNDFVEVISDVDGDKKNDILHAQEKDNKIKIYNLDGNVLKEWNLNFGEKDFVSVAKIYGDRYDNILLALYDSDKIQIFDINGHTMREFQLTLNDDDRIIIGNINGDDYDEIIHVSRSENKIRFYSSYGIRMREWILYFDEDDDIAVGDVDNNNGEEIIHAVDDKDYIAVYDTNGICIKNFNQKFTGSKDKIVAGDVDGDGKDEIIHVIVSDDKIQIFDNFEDNKNQATALVLSGTGDHQPRFTCFGKDISSDSYLKKEFDTIFIQGSLYNSYGERQTVLSHHTKNVDVIVYYGHGYCCDPGPRAICGWSSYINTIDIPPYLTFDNSRPFIFSLSCCTGRYENRHGFGETLFEIGAGVFIGSTEVSYGGKYCCCESTDDEEGKKFISEWLENPNKSIAIAWKERRQDIALERWGENSRYWSCEHQFFGDPKFGE